MRDPDAVALGVSCAVAAAHKEQKSIAANGQVVHRLSHGNPELANVIASGNSDMLKTVKGIGLKTAQRVIVDLKDKIKVSGIEQVDMFASGHPSGEEAVAALVMLGFTQQASQKVVAKILKDKADSTVEQIIKTALKML